MDINSLAHTKWKCKYHMSTQIFNSSRGSIELLHSLTNDKLCHLVFWKYRDDVADRLIYFSRLIRLEVVAFPFAPFLIMQDKGGKRHAAEAIHMPVGIDKVAPLLRTIASGRAAKKGIGTRKRLIKEAYEVVLHGSLKLGVVTKLPVHCFELVP